MLRIIAGSAKGRRLEAPPGLGTRPLPDRIKQSLFDWLGQRLDGQTVADVCAGSGSFGCEAWSRGARLVHLIEDGAQALPVLRRNVEHLGRPPALVLHPQPFALVLPRLSACDLIFCDPPFPWFTEQPATLAELLRLAAAALTPTGRLILRGERGVEAPPVAGIMEHERRSYGRSWVAWLGTSAVG